MQNPIKNNILELYGIDNSLEKGGKGSGRKKTKTINDLIHEREKIEKELNAIASDILYYTEGNKNRSLQLRNKLQGLNIKINKKLEAQKTNINHNQKKREQNSFKEAQKDKQNYLNQIANENGWFYNEKQDMLFNQSGDEINEYGDILRSEKDIIRQNKK